MAWLSISLTLGSALQPTCSRFRHRHDIVTDLEQPATCQASNLRAYPLMA